MRFATTPPIGRRRFVLAGTAAAAGAVPLLGGCRAGAEGSAAPPATPAQTRGPFYPVAFPPDVDNDLVVLRGWEARAEGVVAHIAGRVLTTDSAPLPGARVEIRQCDARGFYRHPGSGRAEARDAAFQGFGRAVTGADGGYGFRTICPVPYPGRTPHIHFAVIAPGRPEMVTQMYVAGEPLNAHDGIYRGLGARQAAVTVRLDSADGIETGALAGRFDIVLA
jgi:protocatechuate 3,4-dioxygenase beta subunit